MLNKDSINQVKFIKNSLINSLWRYQKTSEILKTSANLMKSSPQLSYNCLEKMACQTITQAIFSFTARNGLHRFSSFLPISFTFTITIMLEKRTLPVWFLFKTQLRSVAKIFPHQQRAEMHGGEDDTRSCMYDNKTNSFILLIKVSIVWRKSTRQTITRVLLSKDFKKI